MTETAAREAVARLAKSLFDRGYSVGSPGNISMAVEDGLLITPTNSCLGFLDPARISRLGPLQRSIADVC
jgi:3-dehydro-4-phosphotetronate decarboxylase